MCLNWQSMHVRASATAFLSVQCDSPSASLQLFYGLLPHEDLT